MEIPWLDVMIEPIENVRWEVTDTVHPDRKNIFAVTDDTHHHVGTIVSGSRSKLGRFEADIALIRALPAMRLALREAADLLAERRIQDQRIGEMILRIRSLLDGDVGRAGIE